MKEIYPNGRFGGFHWGAPIEFQTLYLFLVCLTPPIGGTPFLPLTDFLPFFLLKRNWEYPPAPSPPKRKKSAKYFIAISLGNDQNSQNLLAFIVKDGPLPLAPPNEQIGITNIERLFQDELRQKDKKGF